MTLCQPTGETCRGLLVTVVPDLVHEPADLLDILWTPLPPPPPPDVIDTTGNP